MIETRSFFWVPTLFLFLTSCSEDQSEPSVPFEQELINITINEFYRPSDIEYVFLTNGQNEVIAELDISRNLGSSITLISQELQEEFDFHHYSASRGNIKTLLSFKGFSKKEIYFNESGPIRGGSAGDAEIVFEDIPSHDGFYMNFDGGPNLTIPQYLRIIGDSEDSYLFLKQGENGLYKYLFDLIPDQSQKISLSDMSSQMTKVIFDPEDHEILGVRVSLNSVQNSNSLSIYNLDSYPKFNTDDEITYFIPPLENDYLKMVSSVSVSSNLKGVTYAQVNQNLVIDKFNKIDANLLNVKGPEDDFSFVTTGSYDYSKTVVSGVNYAAGFKNFTWTIYRPDGTSYMFPSLPDSLKSQDPDFSLESILNVGRASLDYSLIESSIFADYYDYIESVYPQIVNSEVGSIETSIRLELDL